MPAGPEALLVAVVAPPHAASDVKDEAEDQRVERNARYGELRTASDGRIADARDSGAQLHPQAQRAPTSSTPTASPGAPASRLSAVSNGVPSARARAT